MFTVWWVEGFGEEFEVFDSLQEAIDFAECTAEDTCGAAFGFWVQGESGEVVWESN